MQTPGTLQTGAVLAGRYRVESLLGQGGMAWVFRAVDTHLDRPVAIKVLRESAAAHTERLRREARAAARLAHPAVVGIHDLGQLTDGRPFIVLEFIEGEPLSRLLAEGAVPAARAVHLLSPVAGALGEAHQHGIIHRDLKPDNLLLQRSPGAARLAPIVVSSPSSRVKRKREVTTIWSASRSISSLNMPNGAAARTIATARWSSSRECEGWTISACTTPPAASTIRFIVSSP